MKIHLRTFSYRSADQILDSRPGLRQEIESVLQDPRIELSSLSRPNFTRSLEQLFPRKGWTAHAVFDDPNDPFAKMDFLKDRVGIEVEFGHASFIGTDLLKFEVSSRTALDKIDVGVYIVTTKEF
jgi:hypothetical protein